MTFPKIFFLPKFNNFFSSSLGTWSLVICKWQWFTKNFSTFIKLLSEFYKVLTLLQRWQTIFPPSLSVSRISTSFVSRTWGFETMLKFPSWFLHNFPQKLVFRTEKLLFCFFLLMQHHKNWCWFESILIFVLTWQTLNSNLLDVNQNVWWRAKSRYSNVELAVQTQRLGHQTNVLDCRFA